MNEIEEARKKAAAAEEMRLVKVAAKKEVRLLRSVDIMNDNLKIKQADKRAKNNLLASGEFSDLLTETQVTNKLCMEIKEQMKGDILGYKIHVTEDEDGLKVPLLENNNREVRYIHKDKITSSIFNYIEQLSKIDVRYLWSTREAEAIYKMWLTTTPLDSVKKYVWKSDASLGFRRLPFDEIKQDEYQHPTWDLVLGSIVYGQHQFMHFIGSIFEPKSPNQNYMWLYGSGRNAKGSILRSLAHLMGRAAKKHDVPTEQNKRFWTNALRGKRLCYLPDVTEFGFIKTGFWKSLTGGDEINVERKGGDFYDLDNDIKFIVDSNDKPTISSKRSDLRRIVFVEFKDLEDIEGFEDKLKSELPQFINHALKMYRDAYAPNFPPIRCETDENVIDLAEENESLFVHFFESNFKEGGRCKTSDFAGVTQRLSPRQAADFKFWVKHKFGIDKSKGTTETVDNNRIRYKYYDGFSIKQAVLTGFRSFTDSREID